MYTFVDLFAGCGGFSVGLRSAGLTPLAEVELDAWACETLTTNFPSSKVLHGDIREFHDAQIQSYAGVDVIVGGPPCQGFSVAGSSQFGVEDPRNELPHWFLHWVQILHPRIAIIENVPNILTKTSGGNSIFAAIKSAFERLGYAVQAKLLNSADYGTPQLRRRAIIVATLPGVKFDFPVPTHGLSKDPSGDLFGQAIAPVTVGEALSDLPLIEAGEGSDDPVPYRSAPLNAYQESMRRSSTAVTNHVAMKHTARLIERFKVIRPGQSLKDAPPEHGQIEKITGKIAKNPFKYNNYRLDPDKPSLAIPASFQSLFLHPHLNRNLTAREAARLMGFPDHFRFMGKRTTMSWEKHLSQYNQIGNAVCPPMAEALGRSIIVALNDGKQRTASKAAVYTPISASLQRRKPLPLISPIKDSSLAANLQKIGGRLLGDGESVFREGGFAIPSSALPLALLCATEDCCGVCNPSLPPLASHDGEIPFLISKEGIESLQENGQDHGLDYHLRTLLSLDHQVAHLVAERLANMGLVRLVESLNPRTGRRVRGMKVLHVPPEIESLRKALRSVTAEANKG